MQYIFFLSTVPPVIEGDADTAQNRQVVAGSSLTLECKAAGNPLPLLTWLKDGVPVKASDNLRIVSGGTKLEILNAVEADRGQYLCVATSIAGEQEIKYEVEILGVWTTELLIYQISISLIKYVFIFVGIIIWKIS